MWQADQTLDRLRSISKRIGHAQTERIAFEKRKCNTVERSSDKFDRTAIHMIAVSCDSIDIVRRDWPHTCRFNSSERTCSMSTTLQELISNLPVETTSGPVSKTYSGGDRNVSVSKLACSRESSCPSFGISRSPQSFSGHRASIPAIPSALSFKRPVRRQGHPGIFQLTIPSSTSRRAVSILAVSL